MAMKFGVLIIWDVTLTLRPFKNDIFVIKNTNIEK